MSASLIVAIVFTVGLLVTHIYFLLGSAPLLILKHDTPMDSRFVRSFFNLYYRFSLSTAGAAAASYAIAGLPLFAAVAVGLALLALASRRVVIGRMDSLREQMPESRAGAVPAFRRVHVAAIAANLAQVVLIVSSLVYVSIQMKP